MRIISDFKDYYDGVANNYFDPTLIYNRKIETHILDGVDKFTLYSVNFKTDMKFKVLGVAGNLYLLLTNTIFEFNKTTYTTYINDEIKPFLNKNKKINKWYIKKLVDTVDWFYSNQNKLYNLFFNEKFKSPIFITNGKELITNISLKDIEFTKIKDAFTVFNDLSIFIGEQLNTENTNHIVPDKTKIISKGFDYKFSFRKEKQ